MATNKHAQIRYQALDRCFAKRGTKYFWEDLLEACNQALEDYEGGGKGISRRQLFEDIKYMESDQGWAIPLERHKEDKRVWYRYADPEFSINKRPLNEDEADKLKEALLTLSRFKGMPQFAWVDELTARLESGFGLKQGAERIIEFEENPYLKGSEHTSTLFQAILGRQVLEVSYQGFKQAKPGMLRFHVYYLKQYNNRWFVFGWDDEGDRLTNMALDRIQDIRAVKGKYRTNKSIDFADHFEDVVGVTVPVTETVLVTLLIAPTRWPYLQTKPLHGSQKVVAVDAKGATITLHVKMNNELQALLLSYGEDIQVLKPALLRKTMKDRASIMHEHYAK